MADTGKINHKMSETKHNPKSPTAPKGAAKEILDIEKKHKKK